MTTYLPYRAQVYCNLGHLISGNFADTYLQQAGLIFCRGSVELAGLYQPDIGSPVEFAYTRTAGTSGTAARLPRKLLVLASFANPLRNVTSVQIGCRLSLMRNKRDTVKVVKPSDSYKDATATDLPPGTTNYVSPPISANYIAAQCLVATGITATGLLPLSNQYTVDEFDFSNGYVDILGQLLESEMIVGRMNDNDRLETFSLLNAPASLGPVINETNCFTLSPNGPGELPAEQVITVYDPVPLRVAKIVIPALDPVTGEPVSGEEVIDPGDPGGPLAPNAPDPTPPTPAVFSGQLGNKGGWTRSVTTGAPVKFRIEYTTGGGRGTFEGEYSPVQSTVSTFSDTLLSKSVTTTTRPYVAVAGKYASQALSNGRSVPTVTVESTTETNNSYDKKGQLRQSVVTNFISLAEFAGRLDLTYVFSSSDFATFPASGKVIADQTVTTYQYSSTFVKREVSRYVNWALGQNGQQAVNAGRDSFITSGDVAEFVNSVTGAPAYEGTEVTVSDAGPQAQKLPGAAQLTREVYGEDPEAGGDEEEPTTESNFELGAVESQTSITFKLPLTWNDYFEEVNPGEWETVNDKRKAESLAYEYGKIQNRLLLGNVKGASMQIPVELMPAKPFDPIYLQIGGLTGQYRANGMAYTFNRNGIVGQIDALFWQATGQTGTPGPLWFPVPPAVTVLPAAPAVTVNGSPAPANSGSLPGGWNPAAPDLGALFGGLPTGVAPVYPTVLDAPAGLNPFTEIVPLLAITRSVLSVVSVPYSLVPQSATADMVTHSPFVGLQVVLVEAPVTSLTLAAFAPTVYAPVIVRVPLTTLTLAAFAPTLNLRSVPLTTLIMTTVAPTVIGSPVVTVPLVTLAIATVAPSLSPYNVLALSPVAWWDASDASTITITSSAVSQWNDKSGNSWNLTQSTSTQRPTIDSAAVNGRDAMLWPTAANDDFLSSASGYFEFIECYAVVSFAGSSFTGTDLNGLLNPNTDDVGTWITGTEATTALDNATVAVYINENDGTNRTSDLWPELESTCLIRCRPSGALYTSDGVVVGKYKSEALSNTSWRGRVCEMIAFQTELPSGDRADLQTYLVNKWGI